MIRKMPIKQKKKKCILCGEFDYLFSHHRCKSCALRQDAEKRLKSTSSAPKTTIALDKSIPEKKPVKAKTALKRKQKTKSKTLSTYFEKHIEALYKFKRSEESGESIPYPSNLNICHLFPKRNHKSVQAHETNCIYLTWDEHSKLDNQYLDRHDFSGLEKAFPNSFKLIVERMRIVRASVTEKTKYVEAFDKFSESLDF